MRAPRRDRRAVTLVAVVTATWVAVLLAWSVTLPAYRSADELRHVSATLWLEEGLPWEGYKTQHVVHEVFDTLVVGGYTRRVDLGEDYYPLARGDATPRDQRPAFSVDGSVAPSDKVNTIAQHPPGYYLLTAAVATTLPDTMRFDLELWALRLVSVVLVAGLPALLWLIARRLGAELPGATAAALTPLLIPQIGVLGAAVNNDNLLIISCTLVAYLAVRVATGDRRWRTSLGLGVALALALLAKAWAIPFVPVVLLAYVVTGFRHGRWAQVVARLAGTVALSAAGGWWWIRNVLVFGALQPAGHVPAREAGPLTAAEAFLPYTRAALELVPTRFWAMLSIKTGGPPFPYLLTGVLTVLLLAALAVFVVRRRSYDARRLDAALLVLPFVLSLLILVESTWSLHLVTANPRGLQGRYLFAAICGPAAALGLGVIGSLRPAWRRPATTGLAVGGAVFLAASAWKALGYHYAGTHPWDQAAALGAWSPAPPVVTVVLLVAAACAVTALPVVVHRQLRAAVGADERTGAPEPTEDTATLVRGRRWLAQRSAARAAVSQVPRSTPVAEVDQTAV